MNQQDPHVTKMAPTKWVALMGALVLIGIVLYQTNGEMLQQRYGAKVALMRGAIQPCPRPAVLTVQPRLPRRKNVYFRFGKIPKPLALAKKLTTQATNGQFKKLRQDPGYTGPNIFVPVTQTSIKRKGPLSFDGLISYTQQRKMWMSKLLMKLDKSAGTKICRFVSRGQATFQMNVQFPVKSMRSARQQRVIKFEVTYTSGCYKTDVVIGMKSSSGMGEDYKMVVCDAGSCRVYVIVSTYRLVRDVQKQKVREGKWTRANKPKEMILADAIERDPTPKQLDLITEYQDKLDQVVNLDDAAEDDDDI